MRRPRKPLREGPTSSGRRASTPPRRARSCARPAISSTLPASVLAKPTPGGRRAGHGRKSHRIYNFFGIERRVCGPRRWLLHMLTSTYVQ